VLVFRPEGSLLYVNADNVLGTVLARLASEPPGSVRLVVCDLSAAPHLDLVAVGMLRKLHATLEGQRTCWSLCVRAFLASGAGGLGSFNASR